MTSTMHGILLMIVGVSLLSIMDACIKWLLLRDIHAIQVIAIRGWIITTSLFLILPMRGGIKSLYSHRIKLHLIRALFGVSATFCFFLALKYIPLADATAIFFCSSFFMTAGSKYFLGENVGVHRWLAVVIGFIGVLFVSSPGTESYHPASILALLAGASYAVIILTGRVLTRTDSTFNLVFYFNLANVCISTLIVPFVWQDLVGVEIIMIIVSSIIAVTAYFAMTQAFAITPVSILAPIEYIALVWAVLIGYFIWLDIPSAPAIWGMMLILSAGMYILWRESKNKND